MSRQTIIETAAREDGVTEKPANSNLTPYGTWYGFNGVPWCAIFVSWVYDKAGHPLGRIDSDKGFHYCPSAYNFWKKHNRFTKNPKPGDIILFDWDGDGKSDHTGIFKGWIRKGISFSSWEGNTSTNSQRDGGKVMLRNRITAYVKAFVDPGIFEETNEQFPWDLKRGDQGSDVTHMQRMLYELGYPIIVDGKFGRSTERIVEQFQKDHGIPVTGIMDEIMEGVLQAELTNTEVNRRHFQTATFLAEGASGALVLAMQKILNRKGVSPKISEDGVFGPQTVSALKHFQKKSAITIDGIAGPETFAALGI